MAPLRCPGCNRGVPLYTEMSSLQGVPLYTEVSSFQGVPLYTEVSSFQGVEIEEFKSHYVHLCASSCS